MDRLRLVFIALATLIAFYVAAPVQSQGQTVGLLQNDPGSFVGYTLFSPIFFGETYLIDNNGDLVHSWDTGPGFSLYLLEDGSLIHTADIIDNVEFTWGGGTGGVQRYDWDGNLIWEYTYSSPDYHLHHDLEVLPNGNVLLIAWERRSGAEAIAAGRDPALLRDGELHPEHIIEIEPVGATGGNIVWEWHVWDHLVQDFDATKDNFGVVADHPELIDINYFDSSRPAGGEADWQHANSVQYNPDLDQIVVSLRHFSEIWVIDHSTTTEEAASSSGGNSGKGGDLLYRWGNPQAYDAGDASDQQLFLQHDARWIEPGLPGAGNILVFSNGPRPAGFVSSVEEIVPPVDGLGNYALTPGQAYGPPAPVWSYSDPATFYSTFTSGAQRLPNGNTFVTSGNPGILFEVTPDGETVWKYANPVEEAGPLVQGDLREPLRFRVFRATRYTPDYPGLEGRDLTPAGPLEIVLDSDDDGLFDHEETKNYGTDPFAADTDLDGLSDGDEVLTYGTDPMLFDTDDDGLSDGDEVLIYGTDPALVDTDGDGFSDNDEIFRFGTDPLSAARLGDVNCDGDVSSIDAALVLQLTAGVVSFLFCQEAADVDGDGNTTSVDAALILQFTAGLLSTLPAQGA